MVSFDAIFYKPIPKLGQSKDDDFKVESEEGPEEDFENVLDQLPQAMEKKGKKVIPVIMPGHGTMFSGSGMFLPIEAENYFKFFTKCDEIAIKFVREISEEEFKLDQELRQKQDLPQPLDYNTSQEIDDLIGSVEKGRLNVHVDPNSEKHVDPFAEMFEDPFKEE